MNFYGREEEQKRIDYLLSKADFASGIVYGRHRLGKTELLRHCFYKSKKLLLFINVTKRMKEAILMI